ncbi:MAG: LysR family transcriptional regulator [Nevskiaceae bacterium]|nr:MAG: LysR family transcriptional regulator [Nevskiaceae bacterium]TBR71481.1 MAG: LysR family transcriptional regulator [Nevskiaceae bacterium]
MDLSALTDFHRVAAAGSLGKASRESGRPKATLSRRIRRLEESLGVRLVERGGRALRLTAEGQSLYERTHALVRDIEEVGRNLASGNDQPRGQLRVSAPVLFAGTFGGRLTAEFAARYPEVRVALNANDRMVDPVDEGYDVVIRVNPHPQSELVGRCFAHDALHIVAPPSLPMPEATDPENPMSVPAVAMPHQTDTPAWHIERDGQTHHFVPDYRLLLASLNMVRAAVRAGAGAALLPRSLTHRDINEGRLVLWGRQPGRTVELWALHSSHRLVSPKVSAFMEFLVESFPDRQL